MKIIERGQLSDQERINLEKSLSDECDMLGNEIERNLAEAANTKQMFLKIQDSVATQVEMFKRSKFFLCVAQKMSYEDGINFTENNIVNYLAELEEYISSLITYTAFKREEPNAAISTIPLDKLEIKEFNKKNITVEVPVGVTIEDQVQQEVPGEEGIYNIISAKELYTKFMQLHS